MIDKIILNTKRLISSLQDRFPLLGWPLVTVWSLIDDLKFVMERTSLQLEARLMPGDNQLKKELAIFFKERRAYQHLIHPDFQDIPFLRGGESRFKIIKENLSLSGGRLLDIGASLGYFCHKLEDEGFDCYAVEENRMLCYFMGKFKKAEGKHFAVIPQSIFEYKKNQELTFDVILALSVFHNFLARKDLYLNLIKLLKRLRAKELFFETYLPNNSDSRNYYKDYTPEQFVDFIIKNSCFKKSRLIGKSEKGRPIYKLTP